MMYDVEWVAMISCSVEDVNTAMLCATKYQSVPSEKKGFRATQCQCNSLRVHRGLPCRDTRPAKLCEG